jgi:hypothetical protein
MHSPAIWCLPVQPNNFKLKVNNESNCRTIETKFHIENEPSPRKYQNFRLKIFELCNLEDYPFLAVVVSIRKLKQTVSPESHYKPTLNHACIKVPLTALKGKKLKFLIEVSFNETRKRPFLG